MCKKIMIVALLVGAGLVALKKFDIKAVRKDSSPESSISALRDKLNNTESEIKQFIHQIAVREVEVKALKEDIASIRTRQSDNKKVILLKRDEMKADLALVKTGDKPDGTRVSGERELNRLVQAFKRCEEEIHLKDQKLAALEDALASAHEELVAYQSQREELEVELARLEASLAQVRAQEIKSKVHFDQTKLAKVKKGIADLKKKIEVREKEQELTGRYLGKSTPQSTAAPVKQTDVLKEIDSLFGNGK